MQSICSYLVKGTECYQLDAQSNGLNFQKIKIAKSSEYKYNIIQCELRIKQLDPIN